MSILVVDIGGTHIKFKTPQVREPVKIDSGIKMTPSLMTKAVLKASKDWKYDRVSLGYPGMSIYDRPIVEPYNLGKGWVGFDFEGAFKKPVRMLNDAAMQALGSYETGRMFFLGLGTGLGAAIVSGGKVESMELAHLPYNGKRTFEDLLGQGGLKRSGKKKWIQRVLEIARHLQKASAADYVVLGGGNAKLLDGHFSKVLRMGSNENAFKGGVKMWQPG